MVDGEEIFMMAEAAPEDNSVKTRIKMIVRNLVDWKVPWGETLIIIAAFVLVWRIDGASKLNEWLINADAKETIETALYYSLLRFGNPAIALAAALLVLSFFRKINKEEILNKGNGYHRHPYWTYVYCNAVLGYRKCRLKLVPVPMQFKLVVHDVFPEFLCIEGIHDIEPSIDEIRMTVKGDERGYTSCMNLVLADTYSIRPEQLPDNVTENTTMFIDRTVKRENTRYDSENLVKRTISEVRHPPANVDAVYVFATLNPMNCFNIANEAFAVGGRSNFRHLYVFPQDQDTIWSFADKGLKIY